MAMNKTMLILILFSSIGWNPLTDSKGPGDRKLNCLSQGQTEALIENILQKESIKRYLHADLPTRTPLKIRCNYFIKKDYRIFFNNQKVLITENENHEDLIIINFNNLSCENGEIQVEFGFTSKIEGVGILGKAGFNNGVWSIKILKVTFI